MKNITREDLRSGARTIIMTLIGVVIYSLGINIFYSKAHLLSGGITGLSLLLHYTFGWSTSILILAINIPLFIIGWFFINKRFVLFSLIGLGMLSVCMQLFSGLSLPFESKVTSIVLGGTIVGLGAGIVLRSGATMGGTDIVAKILHKHFSANMAVTDLAINVVILVFAAAFNGIDQAVLTVCAMYISAKVTTFIIDGVDHRRALLIVTDKQDELSQALMEKLSRGVTILDAHGAFTHESKAVLYCVIPKQQLSYLKRIITQVDDKAFFTIIPVNAVYGHGRSFISLKDIDK